MSFETILPFTLKWEGGDHITRDPSDPGGTTKYGISQRAFPTLDIANLTMEQASAIYREKYWEKVALGSDAQRDMAAFDTAVNIGVGRVNKWNAESAEDIIKRRRDHYASIIAKNPKLEKYRKGWENRVVALERFLASLA